MIFSQIGCFSDIFLHDLVCLCFALLPAPASAHAQAGWIRFGVCGFSDRSQNALNIGPTPGKSSLTVEHALCTVCT